MKYTILAADDETELLDVMELYLEKENIQLLKADNGKQALKIFSEQKIHLLLLDIMMPEMDGYTVLKEVRKTSKIPVIILSAKIEAHEKILGLELGADDYISKPYNPLEAAARIKAQLRRGYDFAESALATEIITLNGLKLDLLAGELSKFDEPIPLTSTEYKILTYLMKNPDRVYTKRQIYEQVWDDYYIENDSTLMMHISNLRAKIEDDPKNPTILKTVKGLGYKVISQTKLGTS